MAISNDEHSLLTESQTEELFEGLLALWPDLVCSLGENGEFLRTNASFKALGYADEELLGRTLLDFVHPSDTAQASAQLTSRANAPTPRQFDARFRIKDGSFRWLSWSVASSGTRLRFAVARDVTESIEAKREADELNRFLDAIVENIPNMVFVKDAASLSFVRFNRAGEALLGASRDDLLGKNDYDLFPSAEAAFFQQKDRETLEGKVLLDIPEEAIATPRGERWLHTKKVPLLDDAGTPQYLLGISEDITDLKQTQAALVTSREETEALNRELEAFSYSVAHDLRAPLRSIDGFSQALLEDCAEKLDEDGRKYLGYVRESAQLMGQLIDDILTLSRVSRSDLTKESASLSALAEASLARLRRAEPTRQVIDSVAPGLHALADARLLGVVFDNLLGNAWKFSRGRSPAIIEVGCYEDEKEGTVFFVRDNGAGFDMSYAGKLFGVFQRLHSVTDFEGTGVGLATVQRIVHRHGGRVWADAEVGFGATFHFTLGGAPEARESGEENPS